MPVCSAAVAPAGPLSVALRIKDTLIYLTLPTLSLSVPKDAKALKARVSGTVYNQNDS
jgi:hypothetical protein